jgi:phosphoribosylformylglycinamidine synthase subunit PurQ / glutaminase
LKWGVITFPGSNDDRDTLYVLREVLQNEAVPLWHKERSLKGVDCVVLPGGFSYGDYLRTGAIARFSPVMSSVADFAAAGGLVLGICNGFQVLCEAGLLPGALVRNRSLAFVCREVSVRVESVANPFTNLAVAGDVWRLPIKHGEGCYVADEATLDRLERDGQILLRYCRKDGGRASEPGRREESADNPNGSLHDIAGIMSAGRNVFGLMPHPEHATDLSLLAAARAAARADGLVLFRSIVNWVSETRQERVAASLR